MGVDWEDNDHRSGIWSNWRLWSFLLLFRVIRTRNCDPFFFFFFLWTRRGGIYVITRVDRNKWWYHVWCRRNNHLCLAMLSDSCWRDLEGEFVPKQREHKTTELERSMCGKLKVWIRAMIHVFLWIHIVCITVEQRCIVTLTGCVTTRIF